MARSAEIPGCLPSCPSSCAANGEVSAGSSEKVCSGRGPKSEAPMKVNSSSFDGRRFCRMFRSWTEPGRDSVISVRAMLWGRAT